jgi:hypothetical protein
MGTAAGDIVGGGGTEVGEIAAAAAGDEDLVAEPVLMFEDGDPAAADPGRAGAEEAGSTATDDEDVDFVDHDGREARDSWGNGKRPACLTRPSWFAIPPPRRRATGQGGRPRGTRFRMGSMGSLDWIDFIRMGRMEAADRVRGHLSARARQLTSQALEGAGRRTASVGAGHRPWVVVRLES